MIAAGAKITVLLLLTVVPVPVSAHAEQRVSSRTGSVVDGAVALLRAEEEDGRATAYLALSFADGLTADARNAAVALSALDIALCETPTGSCDMIGGVGQLTHESEGRRTVLRAAVPRLGELEVVWTITSYTSAGVGPFGFYCARGGPPGWSLQISSVLVSPREATSEARAVATGSLGRWRLEDASGSVIPCARVYRQVVGNIVASSEDA